jgi:hypothetical protein
MVFFASDLNAAPPHMGLYYHDNIMIVAPHSGTVVTEQSILDQEPLVCIGGMRLNGVWPTASTSVSPSVSSVGPPAPGQTAGFIYYSQCNSRWGNDEVYDAGQTICADGCGPTSAAMVISNLTGQSVTPDIAANWLTENANFDPSGGATQQGLIDTVEHWGLDAVALPLTAQGFVQAASIVQSGGLVIAQGEGDPDTTPFTEAGHVVVIKALNSQGQFLIANPDTAIDPSGAGYSPAVMLASTTVGLTAVTVPGASG